MSDDGMRELAQAIRYVGELWASMKEKELEAAREPMEMLRRLTKKELSSRDFTYIATTTEKT